MLPLLLSVDIEVSRGLSLESDENGPTRARRLHGYSVELDAICETLRHFYSDSIQRHMPDDILRAPTKQPNVLATGLKATGTE